jgi:Pregnancy-associated plasma protein-A
MTMAGSRRRALLLVAVAAVLAMPTLASPASASVKEPNARSADCNTTRAINRAYAAESFRGAGDFLREPSLAEPHETLPASANGNGGPGFRATIPVYFHVVTAGTVGAVTQKDIDTQIMIMNRAAAGFYGGVDTGFKFALAGVTRTDNAEWFFAGPGSPAERGMKQALTQGAPQALNYYSTTAGDYLGWTYLPGLTPSRLYLDGIVVDWESMYGTSTTYEGQYDLGFTAVHEWGHWANLEHTFYGGCNANGDYIADTPAQKIPTSGCPPDRTNDTCERDPGYDPIHNFMDYSYDQCYYEFTPGQALRAQDSYLYFRS